MKLLLGERLIQTNSIIKSKVIEGLKARVSNFSANNCDPITSKTIKNTIQA